MKSVPFQLWRQDDNGQRFLVAEFQQRAAAEAERDRLSGTGHRQIYWVTPPLSRLENLFEELPGELPDELFTTLLQRPDLKLERIVSRGHTTVEGQWYDQPHDEWVLLLTGKADLLLADPDECLTLRPGDHLLIPAHRRHRVEWTLPDKKTMWLALHLAPSTNEA